MSVTKLGWIWVYLDHFIPKSVESGDQVQTALDYPKIVGGKIENHAKKAIRNILHENIDVQSRRFISELLKDGIKCIERLQSHCANMTFAEKVDMTGPFKKSHIKEGNLKLIQLKD